MSFSTETTAGRQPDGENPLGCSPPCGIDTAPFTRGFVPFSPIHRAYYSYYR